MASKIRPSANDYEKKKIAIAGVIDFNDANNIKYSKIKLFKHFGVNAQTGYNWFPVPEGAEGAKPRGRPKLNKSGIKTEDQPSAVTTKKRQVSDSQGVDEKDQQSSDGIQVLIGTSPGETPSSATPSKNSTGQAGRGRKKQKTAANDAGGDKTTFATPPPSTAPMSPPPTVNARSSSSSHTEQLPTPSPRKRGRPRKAVVEAESRREMMVDSDSDFEPVYGEDFAV